ncbi:MAG: hypothetical protein M3286_03270 [Thermoproteota archaeon]|nr:hypothetical protein [Thermoproteota archaeon]
MNSKRTTMVVSLFTVLCGLSCIAGALPSAIAQQERISSDDEEGLVGGIISNVLAGTENDERNGSDSGSEADQGSMDTTAPDPNEEGQTVDQEDFTILGDNTAALDHTNVDVPTPMALDAGGKPEESTHLADDFCFEQNLPREFFCFDTLEECETGEESVSGAEEILGSVVSGCKGFETPPPDALSCSIPEGGQVIRCEGTQIPL